MRTLNECVKSVENVEGHKFIKVEETDFYVELRSARDRGFVVELRKNRFGSWEVQDYQHIHSKLDHLIGVQADQYKAEEERRMDEVVDGKRDTIYS